mmetsp:Transcript_3927/g.11391  ORF Transcript_3927/g.11391 Transcript_3927/m.11391 type:complete len:234 (+) Transcript_3927:492-1193(+)
MPSPLKRVSSWSSSRRRIPTQKRSSSSSSSNNNSRCSRTRARRSTWSNRTRSSKCSRSSQRSTQTGGRPFRGRVAPTASATSTRCHQARWAQGRRRPGPAPRRPAPTATSTARATTTRTPKPPMTKRTPPWRCDRRGEGAATIVRRHHATLQHYDSSHCPPVAGASIRTYCWAPASADATHDWTSDPSAATSSKAWPWKVCTERASRGAITPCAMRSRPGPTQRASTASGRWL